ncbi:MAG TPA: HAMP domain-containing sensor histidine kinase [Methylomirabilota bacterium]|nr:HAMP domain-containing sensor histidine kinase [Methylomirabilota bacterium]
MRLASKIFAASTLVILALVGVAGWSLLAVDHLVRAHREISTQSLPALQLEASLREAVPRLLRLEARYLVLRDRAYGELLKERADRAAADLERLGTLLRSKAEQEMYRQAVVALVAYRQHVSTERALLARGEGTRALSLSEGPARVAAEQFGRALAQLTEATSAEVDRAQAAVRALESRTWTTILVTLTVTLLAALGATGLVAFHMTRSVRRLSAATARVAEGSFTDPLPVERRDEIGDLTRSFNRMAERLRELEAQKQQCFSQISHELRNPLTAIRSAAQLLLARAQDVPDAKRRQWVEMIDSNVDRMLSLVNQILDFNRLRAGVFPLERQSIGLDKVVARALDGLRPQAEQQGALLEETATGADFMIMADEEALTKVVINLVGNAIKFTPRGGAVRVAVTDAGPHVRLAVRDTGPGIPTADVSRIFEPYQQAHRGRKGSGLGLAIVKELVGAHGGSVGVESEEGKGTCFTVRLPRTAPVP